MARFNIKDGNIELKSCEDISTLAEIIFHAEDKKIQIAVYSSEENGHFILKMNTKDNNNLRSTLGNGATSNIL